MNAKDIESVRDAFQDILFNRQDSDDQFFNSVLKYLLEYHLYIDIKIPKEINEFKLRMRKKLYDNETNSLATLIAEEIYLYLTKELNRTIYKTDNFAYRLINIRKRKANLLRLVLTSLQFITIIGAVSIPFIVNIAEISKLITTFIGIAVAASAALTTYYKFRERIAIYEYFGDKLIYERDLYLVGAKHYSNLSKGVAITLLGEKIEEIQQEESKYTHELEKTMQKQDEKINEFAKGYKKEY